VRINHSFDVDGLELAYRSDGPIDAPAIVFSNSLGTDLRLWDPQIPLLREQFRIVRYDTRGHGRSGVSSTQSGIARYGLDLLALLDHLEIARANICGLSLGGMTAMWIAAHHPHRVEHVIFANTAARIGTDEGWNARIDAVRNGGMAAIRDVVVSRFLSGSFRARAPETTRDIGEMLVGTNPDGYIAACLALREANLTSVIGSIRAPSLIIAGRSDESTPLSQSEALRAAIPGSELVVLETAHLSNVERPREFSEHVARFTS
jgi:3-oxoadipate enol-lactonase